MAILNKLLYGLQLPETRERNQEQGIALPEDENRGVIVHSMDRETEEQGVQAPFIPVQRAYNPTEQAEKTVHNPFNRVQNMFTPRSEAEQLNVQKRSWMWKAQRNRGKLEPVTVIRGLFSGVVVAFSIYETYTGLEFEYLMYLYSLAVAVFLVCDPFDSVARMLATFSRTIVSLNVVLWVISLYLDNEPLIRMSIVISVISLIVLAIRNNFWLRSENWLYTDSVTHALTIDPNNKASVSWSKGGGKRETRTLLHQIGNDVSEDDLEGMMKCVFCLGYWKQYKQRTALENQIAELQEIIAEQEEAVQEAEQIIASYDEAETQDSLYLGLWKQSNEKNDRLQKLYTELKASYDSLEAELEEYRNAEYQNFEDDQEEEQEETFQTVPKAREELIRFVYERHNEGLSFSEIAKLIGKSKGTASNMYYEYAEYLEEQEEELEATGTRGKVVSMKKAMNG